VNPDLVKLPGRERIFTHSKSIMGDAFGTDLHTKRYDPIADITRYKMSRVLIII
jgi:hypothetical protein